MIDTSNMKLNKLGIAVVASVVIVLVLAVGTSVYFYQKANANNVDPAKDLQNTIKKVGKHIVLPIDEEPTIATVSDPEKLKDQPFFARAQKGDKVLIYSNSQKAILYNPTTDMIVEVAPINSSAGALPQGSI
jgi:HSP90 family molecular chaperone